MEERKEAMVEALWERGSTLEVWIRNKGERGIKSDKNSGKYSGISCH